MIWQTIYNVWDSALSALCRFPFQLRKSELVKRVNACLYSLLLLPLITENTENRGLFISAEYFIEQDLHINSPIIKKTFRTIRTGHEEIVSCYKMFCIICAYC